MAIQDDEDMIGTGVEPVEPDEIDILHARVAELERERDQLALSLSATRAERDHAVRSAELLEDELHNSESARRDFEHAWLEGRAIMAVSMYFGRMRGPVLWQYRSTKYDSHNLQRDYEMRHVCGEARANELAGYGYEIRPLYAGSAPVPAAQDFSLMQGGYCCECGHELCDTCAPLHPIMPWPAAQAVDVDAICNAYESGVGHRGRPTANVNPYREGTPEHEAYAIGAKGDAAQAEAKVVDETPESVIAAYKAGLTHGREQPDYEFEFASGSASDTAYAIGYNEGYEQRLASATVPQAEAKVVDDVRLGNRLYVWDYENPEDGSWDNIEEYLHDTTPGVGDVVRLNLAMPLQDVDVEMLEVGRSGEPIRWQVRDVKTGAMLATKAKGGVKEYLTTTDQADVSVEIFPGTRDAINKLSVLPSEDKP